MRYPARSSACDWSAGFIGCRRLQLGVRAGDMPSCGRSSGDRSAMTMTNEGALVPELDPLREKSANAAALLH